MTRFDLRSMLPTLAAAALWSGASFAIEPQPQYLTPHLTASRPSAAAPVRLPPIEVLMFESTMTSTPFLFTPIASLNFEEFQTAPEVKLGIGQPTGEKPSIGGWISFGGSGTIAQ
jgi:hypothetical protein